MYSFPKTRSIDTMSHIQNDASSLAYGPDDMLPHTPGDDAPVVTTVREAGFAASTTSRRACAPSPPCIHRKCMGRVESENVVSLPRQALHWDDRLGKPASRCRRHTASSAACADVRYINDTSTPALALALALLPAAAAAVSLCGTGAFAASGVRGRCGDCRCTAVTPAF